MLAGQVMAGAVVSVSCTMKLHTLPLPLLSKAAQCTVVAPGGKRLPDAIEQNSVTPGQLSNALVLKLTGVPLGLLHSTVRSGEQIMAGGSASTTAIVNVQLAEFPELSVAVQVTAVVPTKKVELLAGLQTIGGFASQLSVAVAAG